jgi:hypothetical protein
MAHPSAGSGQPLKVRPFKGVHIRVFQQPLAPVVRLRLGMDEHAEQLGDFLAKSAFHRSLYVVHTRERQIVVHGAMQRQVESSANPFEYEVVHIHDFRKSFPHLL